MISMLIDGFKHTQAVQDDLEKVTGLKPQVGFNWQNGSLEVVSVTFPRVYDAKPLSELAEYVRASVKKQFKQTPEDIVLGFSVKAHAPGQTAQAD